MGGRARQAAFASIGGRMFSKLRLFTKRKVLPWEKDAVGLTPCVSGAPPCAILTFKFK